MATPVLSAPLNLAEETLADEAARAREMRQLAAAANQPPEAAETAFLRVLAGINWGPHPAEDFVRAVHLALAAGAYLAARHLAADGAEKFPDHAELKKMARILAPPRFLKTGPPDPTLAANHAWFKAHSANYRGQWVAVRNGELLGAAPTLRELREKTGDWGKATVDKIL